MTKEEAEKNRAYGKWCAATGVFLAVLLFLIVLLPGNKKEEDQPVLHKAEAEEVLLQEEAEEEAAEEARPAVRNIREVEKETRGIDVSRFQEEIDWGQVAEAGIEFAMVRIGCRGSVSGEIVEDDRARCNLQEASDNGIYLGAYFFSTAVSEEEALEEARWVCALLQDYPITYPVVYNCEGFQETSSRQYGMTMEERTALARIFLEEVEKAGYTGMFYASKGELADYPCWDTEELSKHYRIWVAQYLEQTYPELPYPEYDGDYDMWQYTDQGSVPGIRTVVDQNVAYFGFEEIIE